MEGAGANAYCIATESRTAELLHRALSYTGVHLNTGHESTSYSKLSVSELCALDDESSSPACPRSSSLSSCSFLAAAAAA